MSVATARSPRAAPPVPDAEVAQLDLDPVHRDPPSGPFQRSQRATASRAKYAACRSRAASARPCPSSGPRANWRTVSKGRSGCGPPRGRRPRTTCARANRGSAAPRSRPRVGRPRRRGEVEPSGEHRRPTQELSLDIGQQVVGPLDGSMQGELASGPAKIPVTGGSGRRAGPGPRRRSSPPSVPRRARYPGKSVEGRADLRHGVGIDRLDLELGRTARARSTNSVTASDATPPSSDSGGTATLTSPATPSASRDVARTLTVPELRGPSRWRAASQGGARSCRGRAAAAARPAPRRRCR